jgi:hypothetical protein
MIGHLLLLSYGYVYDFSLVSCLNTAIKKSVVMLLFDVKGSF